MPASPNDTVVLAGSGGTITDTSGNRWTISPQLTVRENGRLAGFTANVAEIAYASGIVWHVNTSSEWYSWNGVSWIAGNDPLPPPSTPGTAQILAAIASQSADLDAFESTVVGDFEVIGSRQTQALTAIAALQTDLDAFKTTVAVDFSTVEALLNKIITMLGLRITAAAPTFTKQAPPTKPGP